jgi:hypothetical protein
MVVTAVAAVTTRATRGVTMTHRLPRPCDHIRFRVCRVAGLGGGGVLVVIVITTVVAMFVHVDLMRESQQPHGRSGA